jgi:type VI secretion system protein ImpJ
MRENSRVIWKEGLFLQPQHFQQMERSILAMQNMRIGSHVTFDYGLTGILVNTDAVANGNFSLAGCSGVMPDGQPFTLPEPEMALPSRPFADHFSHDQQELAVYLALPLSIDGKANVATGKSQSTPDIRYSSTTIGLTDEVYGAQKKDIEVGRLNFCILFGDEARDNYSTLQVGRLIRNKSGKIEFDEAYIPPLLHIVASTVLMNQMRALLELLLARTLSLSQGRKQVAGGFAEYKGADVTSYLLLQTLNTHTPLLNYFHISPTIHPFELFKQLTQLAGGLCTFSTEVSIRQLPRYVHTELTQVFTILIRVVRQVLEADISAGCVSIPIEQLSPASYLCRVPDAKLFTQARFFLGVSAKVAEKELIVETLKRIKLCSRDRLELLIPSAMPGLTLMHASQPPAGLSTKPGYIYFSLDQRGDFWEGMKTSGTIAFYFPNNFPQLAMEMLALKE